MKNNQAGQSLHDICSTVVTLAGISVLFLLLSLPIITLGLSVSSMYQTMHDVFFKKEGAVFRCFWKSIKSLWKTALPFGAVLVLFSGVVLSVKNIALTYMSSPGLLLLAYDGLLLLCGMCLIWGAALMPCFSLSAIRIIPLAVMLIGKHLFTTLTALLCLILSYFMLRIMPPLFVLLPASCCFLLLHLLQPKIESLADSLQESSSSD